MAKNEKPDRPGVLTETEIDARIKLESGTMSGGLSLFDHEHVRQNMILNYALDHRTTLQTVRIDHQYHQYYNRKAPFCSTLLKKLDAKSVKTLSLRNFKMEDFEQIKDILQDFTQLKEIDFSKSKLTKAQTIDLIEHLPKSVTSVNFLDTLEQSSSTGLGGEMMADKPRLNKWETIFRKHQFTHFGCDRMRKNELEVLFKYQKSLQSIHLKDMGSNIKNFVNYSIKYKVRDIAVRSSRSNVGGKKHSTSSAKEMIRLITENHLLQSLDLEDTNIQSGPSLFAALKETTSLQALNIIGNRAYKIDENAIIEIAQNASLRQLACVETENISSNKFGIPEEPREQQPEITEILNQNRVLHEAIYDSTFGEIIRGKTNPDINWQYIGDDDVPFSYNPGKCEESLRTFIDARKKTLIKLGKSEDEAKKMAEDIAKHYVRHHNKGLFEKFFQETPAAYDEAQKISKMSYFGRIIYSIWKFLENLFSRKAAPTEKVDVKTETPPPETSKSMEPAADDPKTTEPKNPSTPGKRKEEEPKSPGL